MKIRPGEAKLFHADGQTHMMKLTALFIILRLRLKIQNYSYQRFAAFKYS